MKIFLLNVGFLILLKLLPQQRVSAQSTFAASSSAVARPGMVRIPGRLGTSTNQSPFSKIRRFAHSFTNKFSFPPIGLPNKKPVRSIHKGSLISGYDTVDDRAVAEDPEVWNQNEEALKTVSSYAIISRTKPLYAQIVTNSLDYQERKDTSVEASEDEKSINDLSVTPLRDLQDQQPIRASGLPDQQPSLKLEDSELSSIRDVADDKWFQATDDSLQETNEIGPSLQKNYGNVISADQNGLTIPVIQIGAANPTEHPSSSIVPVLPGGMSQYQINQGSDLIRSYQQLLFDQPASIPQTSLAPYIPLSLYPTQQSTFVVQDYPTNGVSGSSFDAQIPTYTLDDPSQIQYSEPNVYSTSNSYQDERPNDFFLKPSQHFPKNIFGPNTFLKRNMNKLMRTIYPFYHKPKLRYPYYDVDGNGKLLYGYGSKKLFQYNVFRPLHGYM